MGILGFFASSDKIVADNIDANFISECEKRGWLEATIAYQYQIMMENIHSEAYSKMIDEVVAPEHTGKLFEFIHTVPSINAKAKWCLKWMGHADRFENLSSDIQKLIKHAVSVSSSFDTTDKLDALSAWIDTKCPTFGERLVAFVCVEAIFFSTSFAVIFWFKKRGLLPGICAANELISRDEGQHHGFGALLLAKLEALAHSGDPLGEIVSPERKLEIVKSCVELEKQFVSDALPIKLAGINEDKMCGHAEFMADRVLLDIGCERHFTDGNTKDPCEAPSHQLPAPRRETIRNLERGKYLSHQC